MSGTDPRLGLVVTHRRYVPYSHAHYGRTDSDEGLLAGYSEIKFLAPIRAGDVVEVTGEVVRVGTRSRTLQLRCLVVCRSRPDRSPSAAEVLDPPVEAVTATATVVVP